MLARRGEGVDGALEAVEGVRVATGHAHLEGLIVLIPAALALGHVHHPFRGWSNSASSYSYYPGLSPGKRLLAHTPPRSPAVRGASKPPGIRWNVSHNSVVHKHKGGIRADSQPGRTCFDVRLPID